MSFGAFALADLDVRQDLFQLIVGGLGTDHGLGVQRVALPYRLGADRGQLEELVVDVGLDQAARRARADLALVEGEHREALERLVLEVVVVRPARR